MLLHEFEDARCDTRPDAGASLYTCGSCRAAAKFVGDLSQLAHVFDRDDDFDFECLSCAGIDD